MSSMPRLRRLVAVGLVTGSSALIAARSSMASISSPSDSSGAAARGPAAGTEPAPSAATASVPAPPVPAPSVGADATVANQVIIAATPKSIWWALATREGLETWMAPHVDVDLRIGGKVRSTYDPGGVIGDGSTIESTVLAFLPERMLALKATLFPDGFPYAKAVEGTWAVFMLDPIDATQTKLTLVGLGYGDDPTSRELMAFFKAGNQEVLDTLKFALEGADVAGAPSVRSAAGAPGTPGAAGAPGAPSARGAPSAPGAPGASGTPSAGLSSSAAGIVNDASAAAPTPSNRAKLGALALLPGGEWRAEGAWNSVDTLIRIPVDLHAFDPLPTAAPHDGIGLGGARESTGMRITARQVSEFLLDGTIVRTRVFVTRPDGREEQRSENFASFRSDRNELRFVTFVHDGTQQEGEIIPTDARTLDYPPRRYATESKEIEVKEQLQFLDDNTMAWRVWKRDAPETPDARAPLDARQRTSARVTSATGATPPTGTLAASADRPASNGGSGTGFGLDHGPHEGPSPSTSARTIQASTAVAGARPAAGAGTGTATGTGSGTDTATGTATGTGTTNGAGTANGTGTANGAGTANGPGTPAGPAAATSASTGPAAGTGSGWTQIMATTWRRTGGVATSPSPK
ncbi:MAG: SRPBCC domain-containing protein [Phycisphaerales bacterium]